MPSIFSSSSNSFKDQFPGEKVILVTRQHWFTLLKTMAFPTILAFMPFLIFYLFRSHELYSAFSSVYWFVVVVYFLVLWNLAFYVLMLYMLNIIIVTERRVIKKSQNGLFKYTLNELELDKVQDITVKIFGVDATFFGYGDLEIQTAGSVNKFHFEKFPDPEKIKRIIMDAS